MKKLFTLILTVVMLFSLSAFIACSGGKESFGSSNGTENPPIVDDNSSNSSNGSGSSSNSSNSSSNSSNSSDSSSNSSSNSSNGSDSSSNSSNSSSSETQPPEETLSKISEIKSEIDENPLGVEVVFKGVVVGFDSMGFAHVGDETGIIYVRAKHSNLTLGAFVKISGIGYVYKGSQDYPEYTRQIKEEGIIVQIASGEAPKVKEAQTLSVSDLQTQSESVDKSKSFHGNLVTVTGKVLVGDTKFTYYLLDDDGNKMVGIHHYSKRFENSIDDSANEFNALNGKKITISGVIYRYYTKENIWTLQYIYDNFNYTEVETGGGEQPNICPVCNGQIINADDHAPLACGHTACASGSHSVCESCGNYLCNGENHSHSTVGEWCSVCGRQIKEGETDHGVFLDCGHSKCMVGVYTPHDKCSSCEGYLCDGGDHNHIKTQSVSQVKLLIDQNPNGIAVDFNGVVIGEDSQEYFYVADESGAIYVRVKSRDYNLSVGDYIKVAGKGYVYRGSEAYPEYTRQITSINDYNPIIITKLDEDPPFVIKPETLNASELKTVSESADISKSFHGNPVQITGTVSVGSDKYSYYLLDENGNKMVGIHHMSQYFSGNTDEYYNSFNALNGQEVTLNGIIYRYYTKENIWTFQYISKADPKVFDESIVNGVKYEISADGSYAIAVSQSCDDLMQEIEIASEFNGLPVQEIGKRAFLDKHLLRVIIPSSIKTLGAYAFENNYFLREVVIEEKSQLTTIGSHAFKGTAISKISLPACLKTVATDAFIDCSKLEKVYFMGSVDDWAKIDFTSKYSNPMACVSEIYFNGELLGEKIILSAVTSVGSFAFYNFNKVKEILLPKTLANIGYSAFEDCNSLAKITLPCIEIDYYNNGTNSMFGYLFGGNANIPATLKEVYLFGAEELPSNYFRGCKTIVKVNLASEISYIGEYAFYECSLLESVSLSDNTTYIGARAFYGCSALTSIKLPSKLQEIGSRAFGSSGLITVKIPFATKIIGEEVFAYSALTTVYIHSGIENLGVGAFGYQLTTVYFTGEKTWEEFENKVGSFANNIGGTKIYISSYSLD